MSDDWKIGDKALCVSISHPMFSDTSRRLREGTVYTVIVVGRPLRVLNGERGLGFAEVSPTRKNRGYPETMFRKIRPDEHEDCEPEFVELLNRSKPKVDLPMTAALRPLATEHGVDLSSLAQAEAEFERKLTELSDWLKKTRLVPDGKE